MNTTPIEIERVFNASPEVVWEAITDKDKMKEWYFDIPSFKAEMGHEFQFAGGSEEMTYIHLCKITEVIKAQKLGYSWAYEGFGGISFVSLELFPEGGNTRLKLTHAGLESFPSDTKDFAKENFVAGWTEIIGKELKDYVEKQQPV